MAMAFNFSLQGREKKPKQKPPNHTNKITLQQQKNEEAQSEFCVKSKIIIDTSTAQVEKVWIDRK